MKEITLFNQDSAVLLSIHADGEMVSLTDLWKASGSDAQKTPSKWQESIPTQEFIKAVSRILNIGISDIIKSKRGKSGGTWAHKQIALEYAQYLDPKLAVLVNQSFFERIEEEKDPDKILDRYEATYLKKGKTKQWIGERMKTRDSRNGFTAVLAAHGVKHEGYRNCTNAVYQPLFGGTAAVVREKKGLGPNDNIRDNMSRAELAAVSLIEALASEEIENKNLIGNSKCEQATSRISMTIANGIKYIKK